MIAEAVSYRLQFIDSIKCMASSLSNLASNLAKGIHKIKCKSGHNNDKFETHEFKYKHCECHLEYINFKCNLIENRYFRCNKNHENKFDENLKKRFVNIYKFSNHDINKFISEGARRCSHISIYGRLGKIR